MIIVGKWANSKHFKTALYLLAIVILGIMFYQFLGNIGIVMASIKAFLRTTSQVLTPILYGIFFAFFMSPGANWFEEKIYLIMDQEPNKNIKKPYRTIAILLVYLVLFGFLFISFQYMVPKIFSNIRELYNNIPQYIIAIETTLLELENTMDYAAQYIPQDYLDGVLKMLQPANFSPAFINSVIGRVFSSALGITSVTFNLSLGFVISFYLLKQKDDFGRGSSRLIYALSTKDTGDKLISFAKEGHYIFTRFFIGKALDSFIIGIICFIGLSLLKNRYALLLSLIIGVTNMIPYFGPFIGGIPAVLITLFEGFLPALFVGLFILALQQFDGLYLGPKILGDSIGLSPFWIITSIIIGGALWGPLGMFFGAPLCALILLLINRWIDRRLQYKNIDLTPPNNDLLDGDV